VSQKYNRIEISDPMLKERIRVAEETLRKVVVPGYDVDVVSSGVVMRFRVSYDGKKIMVLVDYSGSNPGCSFCRFLNDTLWNKILNDMVHVLRDAGFEEILLVDWARGTPVVTL
jgi:metal-sulfur cluster biosynthetic enzyme